MVYIKKSYLTSIAKQRYQIIEYKEVELDIQFFINLPKFDQYINMYKSTNKIPEKVFESLYSNFNESVSKNLRDKIKSIRKFLGYILIYKIKIIRKRIF